MECVLEDALKSFVSDVLAVDRPCSELSLKIFFIFKNIISGLDQVNEQDIFRLVKCHVVSLCNVKEQLACQDSANDPLQILRGQILIRLFFIWVARDCLKKNVDNDSEMKKVVEEVIKLSEMFCIRTDPLQLNAFLSDTVLRMFVDYVPDILACIFDEFLLPLPKELAAVSDSFEESPAVTSENFQGSETASNEQKSQNKSSRPPRRFILSPIKNCDTNSSAGRSNTNRFGKRPSRQILVAARSSVDTRQLQKEKTDKRRKPQLVKSSSMMTFSSRSLSFDHVGLKNLRPNEENSRGSVRRCLFGSDAPKKPQQPQVISVAAKTRGKTTPRKRSSAAIASIADTPPMDKKQRKLVPLTPLSKENNNVNESPRFCKPDAVISMPPIVGSGCFRVVTTPLRQLQQSIGSPVPGAILVPQSPDDSKAGIATRSFYASKPVALSVIQASKKTSSNSRRTMSSYDFPGITGSTGSNENTGHFLFAELLTKSPTTGVTESSLMFGAGKPSFSSGVFPPAELDISPRACRNPLPPVQQNKQVSALLSSPVIESRASRRGQSHLTSPFSVAAGYTCE